MSSLVVEHGAHRLDDDAVVRNRREIDWLSASTCGGAMARIRAVSRREQSCAQPHRLVGFDVIESDEPVATPGRQDRHARPGGGRPTGEQARSVTQLLLVGHRTTPAARNATLSELPPKIGSGPALSTITGLTEPGRGPREKCRSIADRLEAHGHAGGALLLLEVTQKGGLLQVALVAEADEGAQAKTDVAGHAQRSLPTELLWDRNATPPPPARARSPCSMNNVSKPSRGTNTPRVLVEDAAAVALPHRHQAPLELAPAVPASAKPPATGMMNGCLLAAGLRRDHRFARADGDDGDVDIGGQIFH